VRTDVRLGLGWLSVFVTGGMALYGWKIDFETSKPVVWAGVILHVILPTIQTMYAYFIEGDTVFTGKRKTFSKRASLLLRGILSPFFPPVSLTPFQL